MRVIRWSLFVLVAALSAACSDRPKPAPVPDGQVFRINPERWQAHDVARALPSVAAPMAAEGGAR